MKIVVCGSIAYDHVMTYRGEFEDSLNDQDLSKLSVSFLAMNRDVYFGGCAGNICYNLGLLKLNSFIVGAVGKDFDRYEKWLQERHVDCGFVKRVNDQLTSSAFILTDDKENQITFFAPEAMADFQGESLLEPLLKEGESSIVLIGPDFPDRMVKHARDCQNHGADYVFDPGQAIPALSKEDIEFIMSHAKVLIANDFEMDLLQSKLGVSREDLAGNVEYLIETKGEDGAVVYFEGEESVVEAFKPEHVVDPTGCGDAFRAGILKALHDGDDMVHGCRLGAAIATYNIERKGTQNHSFEFNDLVRRMMQE